MLTDETGHVFSYKPHIFTEKNPASRDILNFLTMSSKNQMEQFLKALAKGSKLNFCVINPKFMFWKLHTPPSATAYKRNSSRTKGSIKHIYKMSAFELFTQHYAGQQQENIPMLSMGCLLTQGKNNEYIKKILWKTVKICQLIRIIYSSDLI